LSHQTGFINWRINHPTKKLTFDFVPGTRFQYSGEGFEYLRKALEKKFQRPLEKLLDSLVFSPRGMHDTHYWSESLDTTRFARWHDANGKRYPVSDETGVSAADDLLTTIEDYCKFGIDVMNGAGLSDSLFEDMVRPRVKVKEQYYRCLGWGLVNGLPDGEYALEHGGSDIGVRNFAVFLPKSKRGVVVMTNGDNGMNVFNHIVAESMDVGKDILAAIYRSSARHTIAMLPRGTLDRYTGTYFQSNGRKVTIAKENEQALRMSGDGIPAFVLYPESEKTFFLKDFDAQLEFVLNENKEVVQLITYENGRKGMEAVKGIK